MKKLTYVIIHDTISEISKKNKIVCEGYPYDYRNDSFGHFVNQYICTIKNGRENRSAYHLEDRTNNDMGKYGGRISYWKNEKEIKKAKYMSIIKKYIIKTLGGSYDNFGYNLYSYRNTKANRDKYIK